MNEVRLVSYTKVRTNSIHVSVVSLASERITGTITISEKKGSEVSDGREEKHDGRTSNPSKLSYSPSQRENSRPYHCGYYMCTRSPHCSCVSHTIYELEEETLENTQSYEWWWWFYYVPVRLGRPSSSKHLESPCWCMLSRETLNVCSSCLLPWPSIPTIFVITQWTTTQVRLGCKC